MESRMRRSRNATMTCPWPAQCLVGGKGKRYAERHQEGRIPFIHHGTPTHSQHQRILGRAFRARQGIINEWLRRNLNGCKVRKRMCCPVQAGAAPLGVAVAGHSQLDHRDFRCWQILLRKSAYRRRGTADAIFEAVRCHPLDCAGDLRSTLLTLATVTQRTQGRLAVDARPAWRACEGSAQSLPT
jgi:hypothetical protein